MNQTRPTQSRTETVESLISAMQGVGWESTSSHDDLAERLIKAGVRHPDYIGSHGTPAALWNELHAIYTGVTGSSDSVEQYARYLAKRGWYVDWISRPESLMRREIESLSGMDPRSILLRSVIVDCVSEPANGSVHPYNWTSLPYDLVRRGVTNIDFEGTDVDPTGALDRDLDEILSISVVLGEDRWATQLAERGWVVNEPQDYVTDEVSANTTYIVAALERADWSKPPSRVCSDLVAVGLRYSGDTDAARDANRLSLVIMAQRPKGKFVVGPAVFRRLARVLNENGWTIDTSKGERA